MGSAVLHPSGATVLHSGTESYTGGAADHTNLADADDATLYRVTDATGNGYFVFPLGSIPGNIDAVTGIDIFVRGIRNTKGDFADIDTIQIVKSDGTTAISSLVSASALSALPTEFTYSPSVTLSGQSDWNDAHIRIDNDGGTSTGPGYYEISVTITYTESAGGGSSSGSFVMFFIP